MPCHPDRVRHNYEDDPFAFLEGRRTAIFSIGRGITLGWYNGKPLTVTESYLASMGMSMKSVPKPLRCLIVKTLDNTDKT